MRTLPPYLITLLAVALAIPAPASAHCDTLDGPVVVTARAALESGKLEPVLAWVQPADEGEIRAAFASARAVRKGAKGGPRARGPLVLRDPRPRPPRR